MNDLLQATGYAALVYLLFNYLITFGSGRPLVEWINPGRRYLPLLGGVLFGGAYSSLRFARVKHHAGMLDLLHDLVGKEQAKPEVVGAVSLLIFGLAILMTWLWCWLFLPRSPLTFSANPKDLLKEYARAVRHYVRWAGGLDFAALYRVRAGVLEPLAEASSDKEVRRGLARLPTGGGPVPAEAADGQKQAWRDLAADLVKRWPELDALLRPARQGRNVAISFDVRYGAVYAEMIDEEPDPAGGPPVGVFLFAASLNEHEVKSLAAAKHFTLLGQAVRHIRAGVAVG
jgi:hypothetical protein